MREVKHDIRASVFYLTCNSWLAVAQAQLRSAAERVDQLQSALAEARSSSEARVPDPGGAPQVPRGTEKQLQDEVRRGRNGTVSACGSCSPGWSCCAAAAGGHMHAACSAAQVPVAPQGLRSAAVESTESTYASVLSSEPRFGSRMAHAASGR